MFDTVREQYFPIIVANQFQIQPVQDSEDFWKTVTPLMKGIFPAFADIGAYGYVVPEHRRQQAGMLSRVFSQAHHEYFLFTTIAGEAVGFSYGDMRDSQTFFMTSTGILSAYRRQGLYSAFMKHLLKYLYALGYERVVSNHQPNNRAVIIAKLKAGFNVTAVNLDERWGAQLELTYLFEDARRDAYESAFALEKRETPQIHI